MKNLKDKIIGCPFLYKIFLLYKVRRDASHDKLSKMMIKKLIGYNPTILEIGAHVGSDTAEFAALFEKGKIYAVEPLPDVYERLKFKTKGFPNVKIFQAAISDEIGDGFQDIYVCSNSCSSSLLKPTGHMEEFPDAMFDKKIKVPVRTFKSLLSENSIEKVDLLWIDVQGMEFRIFKSIGEDISKILYIYTEVSNKEYYEGEPHYVDLKAYLEENGFKVVGDDFTKSESMGNVLFKNKLIK